MKLLFDLQGIQNDSRERGIGRYVLNLFKTIASRDDVEVYGLLNGALSTNLEQAREIAGSVISQSNILVFPGLAPTRAHDHTKKRRRKLSEAAYHAFIDSTGCDVLLAGTVFEGLYDETILSLRPSLKGPLRTAILHDLIPLLDQEKYLPSPLMRDWYFDRLDHLAAADLILAISRSSQQEGIGHLKVAPERCINVGSAVNTDVFFPGPPATSTELAAMNISRPFLMHTSAFDDRKNFEGLVEAFSLLPSTLRDQYQLVLVGGSNAEATMRIRHHATKHGLSEQDVIFPGYVSDPDLVRLYRSCSLFVFPSFHEGFGLPALEAMSCGCPTIGSNLTSIPEVIGREDLLFDPHSPREIASLMEEILNDSERRSDASRHANLQAESFSWNGVADRVLKCTTAACKLVPTEVKRTSNSEEMLASIATSVDLSEYSWKELSELANLLIQSEKCLAQSFGRNHVGQSAILRRVQFWTLIGRRWVNAYRARTRLLPPHQLNNARLRPPR